MVPVLLLKVSQSSVVRGIVDVLVASHLVLSEFFTQGPARVKVWWVSLVPAGLPNRVSPGRTVSHWPCSCWGNGAEDGGSTSHWLLASLGFHAASGLWVTVDVLHYQVLSPGLLPVKNFASWMLFKPLHSLVKLLWLNHLWITKVKSHAYVTPAQLADLAQEASLRLFPTRSQCLTGVPGASKVVICTPSHETPTSCCGLLIVCVRAQNPSNLNWSWHPINSNSNSGSFFFFLKTVIPSWTRLGKKLFCQGSWF